MTTSFADLHVPGKPLVLLNAWDAASAATVAASGAPAIATASWACAAAHGYADGQFLPLETLLMIAERITESIEVPLSVDFEGCYATEPSQAADNVARVIEVGAVGINFEDQVLGGEGLHSTADQCRRIEAIANRAESMGKPLFINARADLFRKAPPADHSNQMAAAKERAAAYAAAGAGGLFVPGLVDDDLIGEICAASSLPVNVSGTGDPERVKQLALLGVGRISHGPFAFQKMMKELKQQAAAFY